MIWQLLFVVVLIADVCSFGQRYFRAADPAIFQLDEKLVRVLSSEKEPYRMIWQDCPTTNLELIHRIPLINGYQGLGLKRYAQWLNDSQGFPPFASASYPVSLSNVDHPLLKWMNLKYLLQPKTSPPPSKHWKYVLATDQYTLWELSNTVPRVFLSAKAEIVPDPVEIRQRMKTSTFNPYERVFLEETPRVGQLIDKHGRGLLGNVYIENYHENQIILQAEVTRSCWLVISDPYYPGWNSWVDGKKVPVYRANDMMRAVWLEAGRHEVVFLFQPISVYAGAGITIVTLVVILFWGITAFRLKGRG